MLIIPSGRPKIWDKYPDIGAVRADQAYTGTFHTLCQEYARKQNVPYLILSPKFGFLSPEDQVPHTYDVRFTQKGTNDETISVKELQRQWQSLQLPSSPPHMVLGGQKFKPLMKKVSGGEGSFQYPLHGLGGIGFMQQRLKEAIKTGEPLS